MALTDTFVKTAKKEARARRYWDERAMYLEVSPSGGKLWRLKYRFAGKEKILAIGQYPDISLKIARDKRDEARKLIAAGVDPSIKKKELKSALQESHGNTFEDVAREFLTKRAKWAASHKERVQSMLDRDIFPKIGRRPIAELRATEVLDALRPVEDRAPDTANRALGIIGQIFRYGVSAHKCFADPTVNLRGALERPEAGHFATVLDPDKLGPILRAFDGYNGTPAVKYALRLAPLVFVRPGELRNAEWPEFDFSKREWRYLVGKTRKTGVREHIVPLSTQAVAILREMHEHSGNGRKVFPGARGGGRPISDNALLAAMRRMEIPAEELTTHGLRATARTLLDETLHFRVDIIDHQLAHKVKDATGEAYNRTKHLSERHKMMQDWADYLDTLKVQGTVIQFERSA